MEKSDQNLQEIRLRIKKYLGLENVSVLTGAGSSFHLGAPVIRIIPDELKESCQKEVEKYFGENSEPSYEDLFNCLQAERFLINKKGGDSTEINKVITKMQEWLIENCDVNHVELNSMYSGDEKLQKNKYFYHEMLLKKLLQRSNNLRRASLFTTNYDMAFDYALDNLGIHYINGFMGIHNRCFRPEVYDYDLYYPGQSVSGKVYRAEKVIKYYKLHGSLSWVTTKCSSSNTYGIKELSLCENKIDDDEQILIYPCSSKKSFTLDLPYSELFRQFSQAINQPQSVLICIGYSFFDEHINDIIKQALSIPSFTLIIANYSSDSDKKNIYIEEMKALDDKRVIILDSNDKKQTTFTGFTENLLPDLYEEEEKILISETMKKLYPECNNKDNDKKFFGLFK